MTYQVRRVVSYYARPKGYDSGGVNLDRRDWMTELARRRSVQVTAIDPTDGFAFLSRDEPWVTTRSIPHLGRRRVTMVPRRLSDVLEQGDLLVLHEGWTPSNLVAAMAARRAGIPYVLFSHGAHHPDVRRLLKVERLRERAERYVLDGAATVVVHLPSEIAHIRLLAPTASVAAVITGMPRSPERWDADQPGHRLCWVGRYDVHHKGLDILLAAMSLLDDVELDMYGQDYQGGHAAVLEIIAARGLGERVAANGPVANHEVPRRMADSAMVVHTPRWEAMGRVCLEATAVGAPVVVTESAEIAPVLRSAIGSAVETPPLEPAEIAAAVRSVSARSIERRRAERDRRVSWADSNLSWSSRIDDLVGVLGDVGLSLE